MARKYTFYLSTLGLLALLFGASACDGLYRDLDEIKYDPGDAGEGDGADVSDGDPGAGGEEDVGGGGGEEDVDDDDCDGACAIGEACHVDSDCAEGTCLDNICSLCDINRTPFGGGEGTQEDPHLLCSPVHVDNIRESLGDHFRLEADIDMDELDGFEPIGGSFQFRGALDGAHRTISNLEIESSADRVGMFSGIGAGGVVTNLTLEALSVTSTKGKQVGGLAGYFDGGRIQDVNISGQVVEEKREVDSDYAVGGIVGLSRGDGEVLESSCDCEVQGGRRVGGLVGASEGGTISGSSSSGEVSGSSGIVGGLVGENSGLITGSTSSVKIIGLNEEGDLIGNNIGGFVGENTRDGIIEESHATGDVKAEYQVGGFVGANLGEIFMASATGKVKGVDSIGGFAGGNVGSIHRSKATGSVRGDSHIGGFVGFHYDDGLIEECEGSGTVEGESSVGGFVGLIGSSATVRGSEAAGQVVGVEGVGGFAGKNDYEVIDCRATDSVSGVRHVGGLIGQSSGKIEGSSASGNVSIALNAENAANFGGLVGFNSGEISSSMATGEVQAAQAANVGGLVGLHSGGGAKLGTSFVDSALVEGFSEVGGLVGVTDGGNATKAEVRASYALVAEIRYASNSAGGLVAQILFTDLEETYSQVGKIKSSSHIAKMAGRLVGSSNYLGICNETWGGLYLDSFWSTEIDCETCCDAEEEPGTGLGPTEFEDQGNFDGWDFANTWKMSQVKKRPVLRWEED